MRGQQDRRHTDAAEVRRMVEAALGGAPISTLHRLGQGTDHTAYAVNDNLIARVAIVQGPATASATDREIEILQVAGRVSTIPVPEVVGADAANGLVITRRLTGTSVLEAPASDVDPLVEQLAEFLAGLQAVSEEQLPPTIEVDRSPPAAFLADVSTKAATIAPAVTDNELELVQSFLNSAPPRAASPVDFCHNDLGAEHVLVAADRTTITGIIDWSDAAMTDFARDLGRIYRDLGPSAAERVLDQVAIDDTAEWGEQRGRCARLPSVRAPLSAWVQVPHSPVR